jgi:hypothetical protein
MSGRRGQTPLRQYGRDTDGRYPKFDPQTPARTPENEFAHWRRTATPPARLKTPLPDFIAPQPSLRQRYVSAGGTAKLSDRAEIQGPPTAPPPSSSSFRQSSGYFPPSRPDSGQPKQRYVSAGGTTRLADRPEVAAPALPSLMRPEDLIPPPRSSSSYEYPRRNDSFVASRSSKDSRPPHTPENNSGSHSKRNRERTRSSASARLSKLKRFFSSSSGDYDD